jgi:uncharacterized protein (TIGR02118 family)
MARDMIMNIVATGCPAAYEAKFNKWYNEVHIPLLFKYKGMKRVTRYRLVGESQGQAKYLACYEYESREALEAFPKSPEFAAAMEEMQGTWKGEIIEIKWNAVYEPIRTWER